MMDTEIYVDVLTTLVKESGHIFAFRFIYLMLILCGDMKISRDMKVSMVYASIEYISSRQKSVLDKEYCIDKGCFYFLHAKWTLNISLTIAYEYG